MNQIVLLKKLSLLKLTNLIETHSSATKARLILLVVVVVVVVVVLFIVYPGVS